jgi:hypothetical protein
MLLGFLLHLFLASIGCLALLVGNTSQADRTKQNNNTDLTLGGSWVSGTAPAGGDNAIWGAIVVAERNCINTLGTAATWNGIVIKNPAAPVAARRNRCGVVAASDFVTGQIRLRVGSNRTPIFHQP